MIIHDPRYASGFSSRGAYVGRPIEQEALAWHDRLGDAELLPQAGRRLEEYEIAREEGAEAAMAAANEALMAIFARARKLAVN